MNLEQIKNKKILLFGHTRAFSKEEFLAQLQYHKIELLEEYSAEVSYIVEGRMMNPYEQNESEALYEKKLAEFLSIDLLEKLLVSSIDEDTLLMSLKLSRDKERLLQYIKNPLLSDTLFFRLLKLFDWQGEELFENDANRDVSAAFIRRFYKNIERNHNVEYATLGFMHLIAQTTRPEVIEAVFYLEPIQNSLGSLKGDAKFSILEIIVRHPSSPQSVLELIAKKGKTEILSFIALRNDLNPALQESLFQKEEEAILQALSYNENLEPHLIEQYLQMKQTEYLCNIASHRKLQKEVFWKLKEYKECLAKNSSLDEVMQEELYKSDMTSIHLKLAANSSLSSKIFSKLQQSEDPLILEQLYANTSAPKEELIKAYDTVLYHKALASNSTTPQEILEKLAHSQDQELLKKLAQNENTPIAVLYQLQLDPHLQKFVKENKAFGDNIQSENIGWL